MVSQRGVPPHFSQGVLLSLFPITMAVRHNLIGRAIIQAARIGNDMLDLRRAVHQHFDADDFPAERAAPVECICRVQFLPNPQPHPVSAIVALAQFGEFRGA